MTTFEIVEAQRYHCGRMARILRAEHRKAIDRVGKNAHAEITACFHASSYRRALLIDGRLAALGGVIGMMASAQGFAWLALSDDAARHPRALVKLARQQLDEIMRTRHELATTLIIGDEAAKRFAIFLGFHVAHDGDGAPAFTCRERRALNDYLEKTPRIRVPVGAGWAMAMGYHHRDEDV